MNGFDAASCLDRAIFQLSKLELVLDFLLEGLKLFHYRDRNELFSKRMLVNQFKLLANQKTSIILRISLNFEFDFF